MIRLPPISTLFPYTTLFRSVHFVGSAKKRRIVITINTDSSDEDDSDSDVVISNELDDDSDSHHDTGSDIDPADATSAIEDDGNTNESANGSPHQTSQGDGGMESPTSHSGYGTSDDSYVTSDGDPVGDTRLTTPLSDNVDDDTSEQCSTDGDVNTPSQPPHDGVTTTPTSTSSTGNGTSFDSYESSDGDTAVVNNVHTNSECTRPTLAPPPSTVGIADNIPRSVIDGHSSVSSEELQVGIPTVISPAKRVRGRRYARTKTYVSAYRAGSSSYNG